MLYQALAERILLPIIDAHEARGEKRGEVRGYANGIRAMKQWLARKEAAAAAGLPFNEPPPSG